MPKTKRNYKQPRRMTDGTVMTQSETAALMGCSVQNVAEAEASGLRKLRVIAESRHLTVADVQPSPGIQWENPTAPLKD